MGVEGDVVRHGRRDGKGLTPLAHIQELVGIASILSEEVLRPSHYYPIAIGSFPTWEISLDCFPHSRIDRECLRLFQRKQGDAVRDLVSDSFTFLQLLYGVSVRHMGFCKVV